MAVSKHNDVPTVAMNTESFCETLAIALGLLTFVICEAGAHNAFKLLVGVLSTVQNSIFSTGFVEPEPAI